jgi:hypothetical protein
MKDFLIWVIILCGLAGAGMCAYAPIVAVSNTGTEYEITSHNFAWVFTSQHSTIGQRKNIDTARLWAELGIPTFIGLAAYGLLRCSVEASKRHVG